VEYNWGSESWKMKMAILFEHNDVDDSDVIAAYGTAMAGIPSQISYGSCLKFRHFL
jgi:hypothetical protein